MKFYQVLSYVYNAFAFMLDAELLPKIRAIYLFGSAVREELEAESDIDIFVDCSSADEDFVQKRASANIANFYKSKDFEKWHRLKVTNPISITAGELHTWKLRQSILTEGLVLYRTAIAAGAEELEREVLLVYELPKSKILYLSFVRAMFGRKGYETPGHLAELLGKKISPNAIIIPQQSLPKAQKFFQKYKIKYKIIQFLTPKA